MFALTHLTFKHLGVFIQLCYLAHPTRNWQFTRLGNTDQQALGYIWVVVAQVCGSIPDSCVLCYNGSFGQETESQVTPDASIIVQLLCEC